ncbi:FAD binding domain-containing protein [Rhodococcus sp. X156]|uniref:FAD binding domain-containing protein n=1 Tax=Rhodococcus sp. X156 TaxID=2499145 RepID=UPI000FDC539C|nr:FAD binding domain-containing protein [Rhodococcus sp. X156]
MKPARFHYHRAHSVASAVATLAELGEDAKLIAGGQSLVAMMSFRLARPAHLVDVTGLHELSYLTRDAAGLHVGALTTHRQVEMGRAGLTADYAVIADAMRWIGHLPIRTRGTVGGSIAHADATAEWCLLAVLLDAQIVVESVRGRRTVAASEFFFGFYATALEPDEMIVEICFPRPAPHAALAEHAQRQGDFAVVAVAVDLDLDGEQVRGGRVALSGVGPVPVRVPAAEAVLTDAGRFDSALVTACAEAAAASVELDDDVAAGGAEYVRGLVRTLLASALPEAALRQTARQEVLQ